MRVLGRSTAKEWTNGGNPLLKPNCAFYRAWKEDWRRRVGVEPTNPLLAGSLVLKTRRATGPIPPPNHLRITERARCCPAISGGQKRRCNLTWFLTRCA